MKNLYYPKEKFRFLRNRFLLVAIATFNFITLQTFNSLAQQWYPLSSGTVNTLNSVFFTDNNTGYVCGFGGIILKTTNGGNSWSALNSGTTENLLSIFFTDANTGYVCGKNGYILKTIDGGISWNSLNSGVGNGIHLTSVFFADINTGYVCAIDGKILKTTNAGNNWTVQNSNTSNPLNKIFFLNASTGYVAGANATIKYTNNGGSFWQNPNNIGSLNTLNSITFADANKGFAVGINGTILNSIDGGTYWDPVTSGTSATLNDVRFLNTSTGYAVGANGTILKTSNGSTSWGSLTSGTSNDLYGVFFTSNSGYAVGANGTILKTCSGLLANAGNDTTICSGTSAAIGGTPAATGGTSPYSFNWSPSVSLDNPNIPNPVATPASFTSYALLVTDNNGCTAADTVNIFVASSPSVSVSGANVTCNGGNNGSATASASGGATPYSFNWSNGTSNPNIGGLAAGTYYVTLTGGNGCTDVDSVVITEPPPINISISQTNITCNGASDGTATANVSGGTSPYTYYWLQVSQTTQTASNLFPGNHTVNVTDNNGCGASANVTITEPSEIVDSVAAAICSGDSIFLQGAYQTTAGTYNDTLTSVNGCDSIIVTNLTVNNPPSTPTASSNSPICAGATINLSASFIFGATYSWTGPNGFSSASQNPNIPAATLSNSGVYSVSAFYGSCGSAAATVTVTVNAPPTATAANNGPVCVGSPLTLTGGAAGMTSYSWSGPNGFTSSSQSPTVSTSATTAMAGTYTITVTDGNGCTNTATTTVTINTPPTATASNNSPVCVGNTLALTGGANGMTSYSWSGPNGFTSSSQSPTVSTSATTAMAGTYTITVTNSNGCTNTATTTVTINTPPTATASNNSPVCVGNTLALTGGANGMTSYSWSGPNSFTSSSQSPTVSTSATTAMAGTYTITVTNSAGCTNTATTTVTVNAIPTPTITPSGSTTFCQGGNVTLDAGTGYFTYLWSTSETTQTITVLTSGTYTLTVTDGNGCTATASQAVTVNSNPTPTITPSGSTTFCAGGSVTLTSSANSSYSWSTGATSQNITVSSSGTYTVTVTDGNGCTGTTSQIITVNVNPTPTINPSGATTFCSGDSVLLTATAAATYLWSNGPTTQNISVSTSGNYSVTVTDANGCSGTASQTVTVNPNPTATAFVINNVSCNGGNDGTASATPSGGTSPYSYLWSTLSGFQTLTGLAAGNYFVTVTDANGCTATANTVVTEPSALIADAGNDTTINQGETVLLNANATGGTGSYTYSWSTGATTPINSISPNSSVTLTLTITDANNCVAVDSITVFVNQAFFSIYGTIYDQAHSFSLNNGTVYLFQYNLGQTQFAVVDSTELSGVNGDYVLSNHPSGQYIILFRPDNVIYPNFIPTYYGDTASWQGAQIINLVSDTSGIDISTKEVPQLTGNGFISGIIQFGTGSGKAGNGLPVPTGDPVPGVDISIEQIPGGIIKHTNSNNNGFYFFANLPEGNYKLLVDIPGLGMDSTYSVSITGKDSVFTNLDFVVDTTAASAGIYIGWPLGEERLTIYNWQITVYPNPNNGNFSIELSNYNLRSEKPELKIFNMLGEILYHSTMQHSTHNIHLPANGVYFVQLITEMGATKPVKLIVEH